MDHPTCIEELAQCLLKKLHKQGFTLWTKEKMLHSYILWGMSIRIQTNEVAQTTKTKGGVKIAAGGYW